MSPGPVASGRRRYRARDGRLDASRRSRGAPDRRARGATSAPARGLGRSAGGEIRLADGDAREALHRLRAAESIWYELDAPYDLACVRVAVGQALLALGDADSAALEFDAALRTFRELGAEPDIRRTEQLAARPASLPGGLSSREAEVLRLVAGGHTNRAIASALGSANVRWTATSATSS